MTVTNPTAVPQTGVRPKNRQEASSRVIYQTNALFRYKGEKKKLGSD